MKHTIIGALQYCLMVAICATISAPQSSFGTLEQFMIDAHIYEDRCTLTDRAIIRDSIYCLQSRQAFSDVYINTGLAFAVGLVPAFYCTQYFGFSFTNICCCLLFAAGAVIIIDDSQNRWLQDSFNGGYALMALAAPFALLNTLRVISQYPTSSRSRLILLVGLISATYLSPFTWAIVATPANDNATLQGLFRRLLLLSLLWLLATIILMPLTDAVVGEQTELLLHELDSHFRICKKEGDVGILPENDTILQADLCEIREQHRLRAIFSRSFFVVTIFYLVNSIPLDILLIGGKGRTTYHDGVMTWPSLTHFSPTLAFSTFPLLFWLTSYSGVGTFAVMCGLLSIFLTALQYWSHPIALTVADVLLGTVQSSLIWGTSIFLLKSLNVLVFPFCSILLVLCVNLIKYFFIESIDLSIEFDAALFGVNPFVLLLSAQAISVLLIHKLAQYELLKELRYSLEQEARIAFEAAA